MLALYLRNIKLYAMLLVLMLGSSLTHADFTPVKTISRLIAEDNGMRIMLSDYINSNEVSQCKTNEFFMAKKENSNYEVRVAFLLAAFASGNGIKISHYSCNGDDISASSVYLD
jgi:hypothetical protein